jgi:hypothetical protein
MHVHLQGAGIAQSDFVLATLLGFGSWRGKVGFILVTSSTLGL